MSIGVFPPYEGGVKTVVGIDPSLTATGIAVITTHEPDETGGGRATIDLHEVRSKLGPEAEFLGSRRSRLGTIAYEVKRVLDEANPDLVVIEAPAMNSRTGKAHDRSGLWWLIVYVVASAYPIVEITPGQRMKYATGSGSADKDKVLAATVRRYPMADVQTNNEADALVLAAMGARHLGRALDEPMPKANLEAMDKVRWP